MLETDERCSSCGPGPGRAGNGTPTDKPGERTNVTADDRAGLGDYFARRYVRGEELSVLSFGVNGTNGELGNFQFTLTRKADDMVPTVYTGKGSVVCTTVPTTVGTWSMARDPGSR